MSHQQRTVFKKEQLRNKSTTQAFTCCASLGKWFFVGTKDGTIIFYELKAKSGSTSGQLEYETNPREIVRVPRLEKAGAGNDTISQIVPFRSPRMMLCLTEGGNLYFIPQLDVALQLKRVDAVRNVHVSKMACKFHKREAFCAVQVRKSNKEYQLIILRLDQKTQEWVAAFPAPSVIPENVHSLNWIGNILVLGFAREFCHFDTTKQEMRSVAKAGHQPPLMAPLFPMRELYCSLDELLLPIGLTGDHKEAKAAILNTRLPSTSVVYCHPYTLALAQSEGTIQVHFPWYPKESKRETICQPIVLKNAMSLSTPPATDYDSKHPRDIVLDMKGEGYRGAVDPDVVIVITNDNSIYLLDQVPLMDQVKTLYLCSMFDDALLLAELSPHAVSLPVRAELAINYANHLINARKPDLAFRHLSHPSVSVQSVLKFFPDEYRFTQLVELLNAANTAAGIQLPDAKASVSGSQARFLGSEEASAGDRDSEIFRRAGLEELQKYLNARRIKSQSSSTTAFASAGFNEEMRFGGPSSSGGGGNDMLAAMNQRPIPMGIDELKQRGDLETKNAALIDTALLVVSADRYDDARAIELLREQGHKAILEPCADFLARIGADGVLVALLRAANRTEFALSHLHAVAATGRSPEKTSAKPPNSLIGAKELSDFFRKRMDKRMSQQQQQQQQQAAAAAAAAQQQSSSATAASQGGRFGASSSSSQLGAGGVDDLDSIDSDSWNIENLTRVNSLGIVKRYRPESRQPERLARQVTAVLAAFSVAQTCILESSTTRQATGFSSATSAGGGGGGGGGGSGLGGSTSSLGANPFQKLGCTWLFTDDALPDAFLCEQLFSGNRPLISPRAIQDFGTSPALRIAFIETLLAINKEQMETTSHSALSDDDLRELHNLMIIAFLDRHKRDGNKDQSVAKKLFDFVSSTTHYSPAQTLEQMNQLGYDTSLALALVDSKAEVLARCGRFEDAVDVLFQAGSSGQASAERFCRRVRDLDPKARSFAKLLDKSMEKAGGRNSETGIREGIRLLTANPWVDPQYVWDLLPENMFLSDLKDYLALALQERSYRAHRSVLHAESLKASLLQRQVALSKELGKNAEVHSDTTCGVCSRKIQSSLLARFPSGQTVHHACAPDEHVCPVTRINFASNMPPVADNYF